jgi:hypothetical protein
VRYNQTYIPSVATSSHSPLASSSFPSPSSANVMFYYYFGPPVSTPSTHHHPAWISPSINSSPVSMGNLANLLMTAQPAASAPTFFLHPTVYTGPWPTGVPVPPMAVQPPASTPSFYPYPVVYNGPWPTGFPVPPMTVQPPASAPILAPHPAVDTVPGPTEVPVRRK